MKTSNMRIPKRAKQAGFTIIELVVVILLLGILAATALPRFIDVTANAHAAAVDGVFGGFGTGVATFHAQWVADGAPEDVNGFGVKSSTAGWPAAVGARVTATSPTCQEAFNGVLQSGGAPVPAAADPQTAALGDTVVAAKTTTPTADWVAVFVTATRCEYWYTGNGAVASQLNVPYFFYNPVDGSMSAILTAALPA